MKKLISILFVLTLMMSNVVLTAQTLKKEENADAKVEAYYFHFKGRCATCKTVEAETKANIESLYKGEVSFQAINLDEDANKALAEKLQISGQTLLLVKGNTKINITNEGFMYARSNPKKFKAIVKEKVDGLLKL